MTTLHEIEAAIEGLPAAQVAEFAEWFEEFRLRAPAQVADYSDLDELMGTWREDPGFDAAIREFEQIDEAVWR